MTREKAQCFLLPIHCCCVRLFRMYLVLSLAKMTNCCIEKGELVTLRVRYIGGCPWCQLCIKVLTISNVLL